MRCPADIPEALAKQFPLAGIPSPIPIQIVMKLYFPGGLIVTDHLSINLPNPLSPLFTDLQRAPVPVIREPKTTTSDLHSV